MKKSKGCLILRFDISVPHEDAFKIFSSKFCSLFNIPLTQQITIYKIEYGDPDGGGDLQRTQQYALKAGVV